MLLPWILSFSFALSVQAEGIQPTGGLSSCEPFRVLFFWHTSSGEDESFFQQRRLIIHLLEKIPNGTAIYLSTVDTSVKSLIFFIKDSTDTTRHWMNIIGLHKPGNSGNHIIPYRKLSDTVKNFLDLIGEQRIAEEIILLVNKKSVFDNEEKVKEVLNHRLTIIVFTGRKPVPAIWTDLAIDKEHLVILNDSIDGNVTVVSESIMILFCKDSRLKCDTDKYWDGYRCFRCSFICSPDSKDPSENCLKDCPYYEKRSSTTTTTVDHGVSDASDSSVSTNSDFPPEAIALCVAIPIILIILIILAVIYRGRIKSWIYSHCKGIKETPMPEQGKWQEKEPFSIEETNSNDNALNSTDIHSLHPPTDENKRNKITIINMADCDFAE